MSLIVYIDIFSGKGKEITKPMKTSQRLVYSAEPSFNIDSSHQVLNYRTDSLTIAENLSQLCFLINKKHLWYNRSFKQIKFKWRQIMKFCLFYVWDVWQNLKFAKKINDIYMGLWILKKHNISIPQRTLPLFPRHTCTQRWPFHKRSWWTILDFFALILWLIQTHFVWFLLCIQNQWMISYLFYSFLWFYWILNCWFLLVSLLSYLKFISLIMSDTIFGL